MAFARYIAGVLRQSVWPLKSEKTTKEIGDRGEAIAARYLRRKGYKILTRQWHARHGEIDILARHGDILVIVEVKTRSREDFGRGLDAVDREKQRHLSLAALEYLRKLGSPDISFRFDVVEVVGDTLENPDPLIRHIEQAFPLFSPFRY